MNDYAKVTIGDYTIPLIGIPQDASEMECECCHKILRLTQVELNEAGNQFLCKKCRQN